MGRVRSGLVASRLLTRRAEMQFFFPEIRGKSLGNAFAGQPRRLSLRGSCLYQVIQLQRLRASLPACVQLFADESGIVVTLLLQ
jgi:hypothetical protein